MSKDEGFVRDFSIEFKASLDPMTFPHRGLRKWSVQCCSEGVRGEHAYSC